MNDRPNPDHDRFNRARSLLSLAAQLDDYGKSLRQSEPAVSGAYQVLIDRLIGVGAGGQAPKEGDILPPFLLPDENGHLVSSADLLTKGPLVVSFNRGSWCPYCWLELTALNDSLSAVAAKGGQILSITPEVTTYSRRLKDQLKLGFTVLTDMDNAYALELGLAMPMSAEIKAMFVAGGIDLGMLQRNDAWLVPIPATIAVGRDGRIARAYVNPDFRKRLDPATLLDCLD